MTGRVRCAAACEECKRRKERCAGDGQNPCILCIRRGREAACIYTTNTPISSDRPLKRRRLSEVKHQQDHVPASIDAKISTSPCGATFCTGPSGSLAFLQTTASIIRDSSAPYDFGQQCEKNFMIEDFSITTRATAAADTTSALAVNKVDALATTYFTVTRGIFDLFDDTELLQTLNERAETLQRDHDDQSAVLRLVLAIGAQERGDEYDDDLAKALFEEARQIGSQSMLESPTIVHVRIFLLLSLYLFIIGQRNSAFVHLGIASRSAQAIGLHRPESFTAQSCGSKAAWLRTGKCLRILDVYCSASMGRPLTTRAWQRRELDDICSLSDPSSTSLDEQIDSAGMQLCDIAESILIRVYDEDRLTTSHASDASHALRRWTQHLPDILVYGAAQTDRLHSGLSEELCLTSLTGAYYWTINLLTRPFLIASVRAIASREKANQASSSTTTVSPDHVKYVDACINSAFRCIDVTMKLLEYSPLPKKLFLQDNTTLVSAITLGLAFFGNYDQSFPLADGLDKAIKYLTAVSESNTQAAHYAKIVVSLKAAALEYVRQRDTQNLRMRSAQVEEIFGSVHEKHEQLPNCIIGDGATPRSGLYADDIFSAFNVTDMWE